MKVDLLKTKVSGRWMVEISNIGWTFTSKAIRASLFDYIHDAYIAITGNLLRKDEHSNRAWEIMEYSPEKRKIWVRKK